LGNGSVTNVKTSGTITAGTITYPNSAGTNGQVLTTNGAGLASWTTPSSGSGSSGNFVDLTTDQTIDGSKTFTKNITINDITVGNNAGNQSTTLGLEANELSGENNTAIGFIALNGDSGSDNTAVGTNALRDIGTTSGNTAIGVNAGSFDNTGGNNNTYLGAYTGADNSSAISNSTAIGYNALLSSNNTIQLGNSSITKVKTSGTVNSNGIVLTSDKRLKTNIIPIQNGVETIMKLNPVHYDKKNALNSNEYTKTENGFIAQEIQKVLPFVVIESTDKDKLLSVDYNSIIPVLTKAIQEQQNEINELKELVKQLINKK